MPKVTFFTSLAGYQCADCDAVFLTPDQCPAGQAVGEAHGVRYCEQLFENACPHCGCWDLEEVRVCANCEEAEAATTDGMCLECDPVVETEEQQT